MLITKKYRGKNEMMMEVEIISYGTGGVGVKATFYDGDMLDYDMRPFFQKHMVAVADKHAVGFITPGHRHGVKFETTDLKSIVDVISDLVECIPLAKAEYKKHMNEIDKMLSDVSVDMEFNGWSEISELEGEKDG